MHDQRGKGKGENYLTRLPSRRTPNSNSQPPLPPPAMFFGERQESCIMQHPNGIRAAFGGSFPTKEKTWRSAKLCAHGRGKTGAFGPRRGFRTGGLLRTRQTTEEEETEAEELQIIALMCVLLSFALCSASLSWAPSLGGERIALRSFWPLQASFPPLARTPLLHSPAGFQNCMCVGL